VDRGLHQTGKTDNSLSDENERGEAGEVTVGKNNEAIIYETLVAGWGFLGTGGESKCKRRKTANNRGVLYDRVVGKRKGKNFCESDSIAW